MVSNYRGQIVSFLKVVALVSIVVLFYTVSHTAHAAQTLPSYMSGGDLGAEVESKGAAITKVVATVVVILCGIGIFAGAGLMGVGKQERGKEVLIGSVIGLIISGLTYSIVALVTR